jgi:hypothetical protein
MLVDGIEVEEVKEDPGFDEFFTEAMKDEPVVGVVTEEAKVVEDAKVAEEAKVAEAAKVAEEAKVAKEVKITEAVKVAEVKEDPRVAALEKELAEVKVALAKPVVEVPKGPTSEELKQTEEDDKTLADYEKNWEDHAKAQKINNKRILSEVEKIFKSVVDPLIQKIPGIEQTIATTATDKALDKVLSVHADAVTLVPEVDAWIATLPKYLQRAAQETLDGGSPADVIELFTDFKDATGRTKDPVVVTEKEVIKPEENKRVLSLVSPKSSRTGVAASVDAGDFDGAFAEALKVI